MGIELKATSKALKFRASDMVGRKPVRFLLQESTGFSIPADSKSGQFTATGVEHDPLANLRKVEASRPGFHFRGTENLDVLVHGRRESREQSKH